MADECVEKFDTEVCGWREAQRCGMFGGKVKLGMKLHNDDVEDLQFGTLNLLLVEGAGVASEGG